jgi:hypothetical protein
MVAFVTPAPAVVTGTPGVGFAGQTTGTVPDYGPILGSIATQLYVLNQNVYNYLQFEATSLAKDLPSTPIAIQAAQHAALKQMMLDLNVLSGTTGDGVSATSSLNTPMAGITVALQQLVANIQLAAANQIDKAEFDKAATNAALKRNNLPEVTVPQATVETSIKTSAQRAVTMASAVETTGAVNAAIGKATTFVTTQLDNYILNPITGTLDKLWKDSAIYRAFNPKKTAADTKVVTSEATQAAKDPVA